ncbi:MAG: hypothetical protein ABIM44_01450 [candidate division WOR-3 bacterium]
MYRFNFYKKTNLGKWIFALILGSIGLGAIYLGISYNVLSHMRRILIDVKVMPSSHKGKITGVSKVNAGFKTIEGMGSDYRLKAVLISGEEKYAFIKRGDESYFLKEGMILGALKVEYITVDSVIMEVGGKKVVVKW